MLLGHSPLDTSDHPGCSRRGDRRTAADILAAPRPHPHLRPEAREAVDARIALPCVTRRASHL
jgi:hypothetical protein